MGAEERNVQTDIMEFLESKGFRVIKVNNGAHKVKGGQYGRRSKSNTGVSDLLFCTDKGQFGAIEVKKSDGCASPEQIAFVEDIKKRGGFALIAYSLADVINALTIDVVQ